MNAMHWRSGGRFELRDLSVHGCPPDERANDRALITQRCTDAFDPLS
jgi:hypothetical protein